MRQVCFLFSMVFRITQPCEKEFESPSGATIWTCWFSCSCYLVARLYPTLCDFMNCSPPGSSVHGIFQARTLEWVAMSSSRGSSQPRGGTPISCWAGRFFMVEPLGKPSCWFLSYIIFSSSVEWFIFKRTLKLPVIPLMSQEDLILHWCRYWGMANCTVKDLGFLKLITDVTE